MAGECPLSLKKGVLGGVIQRGAGVVYIRQKKAPVKGLVV